MRKNGDAAVRAYTEKFDGAAPEKTEPAAIPATFRGLLHASEVKVERVAELHEFLVAYLQVHFVLAGREVKQVAVTLNR